MDLDTKPNFISDLFFLLNAVHHLGLGKTVATRVKAERNISDMEKDLKHLESKREEWAGVSLPSSSLLIPSEPGVASARGSPNRKGEERYRNSPCVTACLRHATPGSQADAIECHLLWIPHDLALANGGSQASAPSGSHCVSVNDSRFSA